MFAFYSINEVVFIFYWAVIELYRDWALLATRIIGLIRSPVQHGQPSVKLHETNYDDDAHCSQIYTNIHRK